MSERNDPYGVPRGGGGGPPRGGGGGPPRGGGGGPPRGGGGGPPGGNNRNEYKDPPSVRSSVSSRGFGRRLDFFGSNISSTASSLEDLGSSSSSAASPLEDIGSSSGATSSLEEEDVTTHATTAKEYARLGPFKGVKPQADSDQPLLHMDLPPNDLAGNPVPGWCVNTARGPMRFTEPAEGLYALPDNWLSEIPLIVRPTVPGLYTWIMYTTEGDHTIKFVCKRVYSLYEIGSRHYAIARDPALSKIDRVYGAGELRFDGTTIHFNCASGAYMLPLVKDQLGKSGKLFKSYQPFITDKFRTFFSGISTSEVSDTVSLLTNYPFEEIPEDVLRIYDRRGIVMSPCSLNASTSTSRRRRTRRRKSRKTRRTRRS